MIVSITVKSSFVYYWHSKIEIKIEIHYILISNRFLDLLWN